MKKLVVICTILCAFASCASSNFQSSRSKATHLISLPENSSLIFYGVSGPQLKPELEVEAAREDAAKKVSLYHGLSASSSNSQGSGSNALEYFSDSNFQMEYDSQLDRYIDGLTHNPETDITHGDGVMYVRFSYPGIYPVDISYTSEMDENGNPSWIKHPPLEIGGFMAQVGFARRQQRVKDTIAKASEDAIANLISRSSSSINTSITSRNDSNTSVVSQKSSGKLLYFMVLETWIDHEDLSVWTLAIARNEK